MHLCRSVTLAISIERSCLVQGPCTPCKLTLNKDLVLQLLDLVQCDKIISLEKSYQASPG